MTKRKLARSQELIVRMNKAHAKVTKRFGDTPVRLAHELVRASCAVAVQYAKEERVHMHEAGKRKR